LILAFFLNIMTYPSGEIIEIGNLIWINGGAEQAIVSEIVDDRDQLALRGLDDLGIFVSQSRPSDSTPSWDIFIGQRFFEDEGIGPVAPHELPLL
jgi:hypothetical protein